MTFHALAIPDAYVHTPQVHSDERGSFTEVFRADELFETTGRRFSVAQVNTSVSARGVVRGIHFTDVPLGQAKFVSVAAGAVMDYVLDLRVGSPTFGTWDAVRLDDRERRAVFLPEGLGHAFLALDDRTVVTYAVSDVFRPEREHGLSVLSHEIGHDARERSAVPLRLSEKDLEAPTLEQAIEEGLLPDWTACQERYAELAD